MTSLMKRLVLQTAPFTTIDLKQVNLQSLTMRMLHQSELACFPASKTAIKHKLKSSVRHRTFDSSFLTFPTGFHVCSEKHSHGSLKVVNNTMFTLPFCGAILA